MASSSLCFVPLSGLSFRRRAAFSTSYSPRCSASLNDPPEKSKSINKARLIPDTLQQTQQAHLSQPLKLAQYEQEDAPNDVPETSAATSDDVPLDDAASSRDTPSPTAVFASIGALAMLGTISWAVNNPDVTSATMLHMLEEFITGPRFLISIGMGLSAFIQALTGFGFAVISVGAMTQLDWVVNSSVFEVVQPVAASLGALTGWALLLPELKKVKWADLSTVLIASTIATPFGVLLLDFVDAKIVLKMLGALISGYVAYSVTGVEVPKKFGGTAGAWALGLLAGGLGGAFDITGPPLVVHGEAAQWDQADGTFRRNVLAVVSINSSIVVLYDLCVGRLADYYYLDFVKYAMPAVVVGIVAGNFLSKRLDPAAFKKIVLGTCMGLGAKLLFS